MPSLNSHLTVCKFGGSSVASAAQFQKIKAIVKSDPKRRIVIVSAPGKAHADDIKITDLLFATYDLASRKLDFSAPYNAIVTRFQEIAHDLGLSNSILTTLHDLADQLKANADSLTTDFVTSRGEYLCAKLMAEYLGATFIDAIDLIEIDPYGRANKKGFDKIAALVPAQGLCVIPGFYGMGSGGKIKIFSRGGSDITGAILANGLNASLYENWTDVSGLLMADPRIVKNPKPMMSVSYREIRELAYMGANVFHDEAIAPCSAKNIPINIKNTNIPTDPGTTIGPVPEQPHQTVTGVAGKKDFAMIYIEKNMMNKERGFGRKILGILEAHNVSYEHSPTGIDSMSVIVDQKELTEKEEIIVAEINRTCEPDEIKISRDLSLIATVGHGMSHKVGVSAQLFSALAKANVNVSVIDQGSSEINIIIGVKKDDFTTAINAIYNAFVGNS